MRNLTLIWFGLITCGFFPTTSHAALETGIVFQSNTHVAGGPNAGDTIDDLQVAIYTEDAAPNRIYISVANGLSKGTISGIHFQMTRMMVFADDESLQIEADTRLAFFQQEAPPLPLSGGHAMMPPFVSTLSFTPDSMSTGIFSGEQLTLVFDLAPGRTFSSLIDAMGLASSSPSLVWDETGSPNDSGYDGLRIGLNVSGLGEGNDQEMTVISRLDRGVVPEPPSVFVWTALGMLGMLPAGRFRGLFSRST
jgi:hypothetical protein